MKVLKIIAGVILLLPGICSVGAIILFLPQFSSSGMPGMLVPIWLATFAAAWLGVWLIRKARNRP